MAQHRRRHRLDVVGHHEVAAAEQRLGFGGAGQGDAGARAAALDQAGVLAGGAHQAQQVVDQGRVDQHLFGAAGQLEDAGGVGDRRQLRRVQAVRQPPVEHHLHHARFVRLVRVVDQNLEQEAVQLRLRQRVGAFLVERVLGGQHHERRRQREAFALDGDLPLLHHFQQRRLGLGRRPVDLVGEQQVGEGRPLAHPEVAALAVEQGVAGDVRGHQVGGELDALKVQLQHPRQAARQQRLAEPGHAFDQHMAAGDQGDQHLPGDRRLAHQHLVELLFDAARQGAGLFRLAGHKRLLRVCSIATRSAHCWRSRGRGGRVAPPLFRASRRAASGRASRSAAIARAWSRSG